MSDDRLNHEPADYCGAEDFAYERIEGLLDRIDALEGIVELERTNNAELEQRLTNQGHPSAMCCLCFGRFPVEGLSVTADGEPEDVCKLCAAREMAQAMNQNRDLTAERDRLTRVMDAIERKFDDLNEPDELWTKQREDVATGAAIIRSVARAALVDPEPPCPRCGGSGRQRIDSRSGPYDIPCLECTRDET